MAKVVVGVVIVVVWVAVWEEDDADDGEVNRIDSVQDDGCLEVFFQRNFSGLSLWRVGGLTGVSPPKGHERGSGQEQ